MFLHIGEPKSIEDLNKPSLKLNKIDRIKVPILVIDDNDFEYLDHLKNHRFDITYFSDIQSIESANEYEIILCDINGVGKIFDSKYEGAHVISELYKKSIYPLFSKSYANRYIPLLAFSGNFNSNEPFSSVPFAI